MGTDERGIFDGLPPVDGEEDSDGCVVGGGVGTITAKVGLGVSLGVGGCIHEQKGYMISEAKVLLMSDMIYHTRRNQSGTYRNWPISWPISLLISWPIGWLICRLLKGIYTHTIV